MIDSHCHLDRLDLERYRGDLGEALQAARAAGVERFLCISICLDAVEPLLAIAREHDDVDASIGIHPLDLAGDADVDALQKLGSHDEFVALGETGLDYHYAPDNRDRQRASFIAHLEAGATLNKPVVVHSREAAEDTLNLIRRHGGAAAGVLHCFTGDREMAEAAIDLGYYISFSGIVTFNNADSLREVARHVPADRLLIETDSPYLAPVPYRGRSNEPRYLPEVAKCLAAVRGESLDELSATTNRNYFRLFHRTTATELQ